MSCRADCDDDESAGVLKSASSVSWAVAAAVYTSTWLCALVMPWLWLHCTESHAFTHRRRRSVDFGAIHFCLKICLNKIPVARVLHDTCTKINKMPKFYVIFASKIFFPNFGEQLLHPPLPRLLCLCILYKTCPWAAATHCNLFVLF